MPSGRPKSEVDEDILIDLLSDGWNKTDISQELGVSVPTLNHRIADLQKKEGMILQYRALQSLELTEIQAKILEQITPEKIIGASLRDLVTAYKILKDKELVSEGRPNEIKGLVGYLVQLEKEEGKAKVGGVQSSADIIDAEIVTRGPSKEMLEKLEEESEKEIKLIESIDDFESWDGMLEFDLIQEGEERNIFSPMATSLGNQRGHMEEKTGKGLSGDSSVFSESPFPLGDLPDL